MALVDVIENLFFEDKLFGKAILEGARYLYENSILCDVELVVEGKKIEAHKSILAAASLYFRGMFCAGLKETGLREITIQDVDFQAMHSVISFFYTSHITLTEDNIFDVINVVDLLGVSNLHPACIEFLRHSITIRNCISVYIVCLLHRYPDMAQQALSFACRNFSHLMETEEFLDMPADMLLACLNSKVLNIYTENSLLNRICAWVKHDMKERGHHLTSLLNQINVYTVDLTRAESSLYQLSELQAEVFRWLEKVRHFRERGLTMSSRNKQRLTREKQVVLSCGGNTGTVIANVEALVTGDTGWRCTIPSSEPNMSIRVIPPLRQACVFPAVAQDCNHVYVIGGRGEVKELDLVTRYCVDTNEWVEMPSLPEPLEGAAAAVTNGSVYVTGGFNTTNSITNKTWVLDPGQRTWKALPPMTHCRAHHALLAVHDYIYAVAGAGPDGSVQSSMERMSVHTHQWQLLSPLQQPRSHFAAVTLHTKLYIMGGNDIKHNLLRSVQVYDTLSHEWAFDTEMPSGRHSHGATVADGKIYVAAGTNGINHLGSCDLFNPRTHVWHSRPSMLRARFGQAMATITIPLHNPENP